MSEYYTVQQNYRDVLRRYTERAPAGDVPDDLDAELRHWEAKLIETPPPGVRQGLLVAPDDVSRVYHRRNDVIPFADSGIELIDGAKLAEMAAAADTVRPYVWTTLNQGSVGSCASEAITGAVMALREWCGAPQVLLNPWSLYYETSGGRDQGSTLQDNLAKAQSDGICPEADHPRSLGWRARPSSKAQESAKRFRIGRVSPIKNWHQYASALVWGVAVYWGYSGHAIWAGEFVSGNERSGRFRYKNSWGADWGEDGWGTITSDRIMWQYGAYAILSVLIDDVELPAYQP